MAKEKIHGSTKRFGPRYGRSLRKKLDKIEESQRSLQKCPYCHFTKVKRISSGIWQCNKCGSKFTGKAYSIKKVSIDREEIIEEKDEIQDTKLEEDNDEEEEDYDEDEKSQDDDEDTKDIEDETKENDEEEPSEDQQDIKDKNKEDQ